MGTDLGTSRRAIGATNEAARRGIGAGNEAARRGIGQRIQAERRGAAVQDDINSLVRPERPQPTLRTVEARGGIPAQRGRGTWTPPATTSTGGGIASPLTEKTKLEGAVQVADREYYSAGLASSDGLLVLPAIKKQTFTDANGATVVMDFATPGAV